MMLRSTSILVVAAAVVTAAALTASASGHPNEAAGGDRYAERSLQRTALDPPREFLDRKGNRWIRVRQITEWAPADVGEEQFDTPKDDILRLSDEELAERLRPIALIDGWEYEAAEAPLQLARDLKSGAAERYIGVGEPAPGRNINSGTEDGPLGTAAPEPARMLNSRVQDRHSGMEASDRRRPQIAPKRQAGRRPSVIFNGDSRSLRRDNTSWPMSTQILWRVGVKCSSSLIGRSTAVSVAHCFVKDGKWRALAQWAPGVDSQDANAFPFGDTYGCYVPMLRKGYMTTGKFTYDYAVVEFSNFFPQLTGCPNQHPGDQTGWLGWWQMGISKIEQSGRTGYVYGYPAEKANWPQIWGMGQTGGFDVDGTDEIEYTVIDTSGGQSGSGFYVLDNGNRYVVGAHQGAENPAIGSWRNRARRIDGSFTDLIKNHSAKG
jgi:V8-like Glu-specific endopeptidase